MSVTQVSEFVRVHWPDVLVAAAGGLLALLVLWLTLRNVVRAVARRSSAGIVFAVLGAALATLVSTNTSWRFFADHLGMHGTAERASMFTVAEVALFACALLARENLLAAAEDDQADDGDPDRRPSAGTPGVLVWVISGVACVPAFAEGHGLTGSIVRCVLGPLGAAVLWHLALGVEMRIVRPHAAAGGLLAVIARQVRERVLARLGMAEVNRDAVRIARDRAITRAVVLADKLSMIPDDASGWRMDRRRARVSAALRKAVRASGAALDAEARDALLAQVAASRSAAELATIPLVSPWDAPVADAPAPQPQRIPKPVPNPVGKPRPASHRDAVRAQVRDVAEAYRKHNGAYPSARTLAAEAKVRQGTASAVLRGLGKTSTAPAAATTPVPALSAVNGHAAGISGP